MEFTITDAPLASRKPRASKEDYDNLVEVLRSLDPEKHITIPRAKRGSIESALRARLNPGERLVTRMTDTDENGLGNFHLQIVLEDVQAEAQDEEEVTPVGVN